MIKSSCLSKQVSISSVLGQDYTEPTNEDERELRNGEITQDVDQIYDDLKNSETKTNDDYSAEDLDDELNRRINQETLNSFGNKFTLRQELPTQLFTGKKWRL